MFLTQGSYLGPITRLVESDDFIISISRYDADQTLPKHLHERAYWSMPLRGLYKEKTNSKEMEINGKNIIFRPAGHEHANAFSSSLSCCFNVELKSVEAGNMRIEEPHVIDASLPFVQAIAGIIRRIPVDEVSLYLQEFLGTQYDRTKSYQKSNRLIKETKDYIQAYYAQPIGLSPIAKHLGVSSPYLARLFKKHEGHSIGDYLRRVRVCNSYLSLFETQSLLTEVALTNGYYDQAHFIKSFKRHFGVNPNRQKKLMVEVN